MSKQAETHPEYAPPSHLSPSGQLLWAAIVPRRAKSPARLALLQAALESRDTAEAARQAIASTGLISEATTGKMPHIHPLVRVEKEARGQFAKIMADLSLTWDPQIDGRS